MAPRILTTAVSEDVPEQTDLDPAAWLARDDSGVMGHVSVRGGRLKVGALLQGEIEEIRQLASKINPRNVKGERILDPGLFNRWVISKALSKANGGDLINPDQLSSKLSGELKEIAAKVLALSGYKQDGERDDDLPFDSADS